MEDYDSNTILSDPLTSRAKIELIRAVTKLYENLKERGLQPRLHMIDNECYALMKKFIRESGASHQLVPPGLHRDLIAEREMQTFKAHLITGLSSCKPNSPLHLWDRLIRK